MSKVGSLTEICDLRVSVESYMAPKDRCNVNAANALATRRETADTHRGASPVRAPTSPVDALPRGNRFNAVAVGETTQRTTVSV